METVIVTGSSGLIGSEAVQFFAEKGMRVLGIDNDMRKYFFGDEASIDWNLRKLQEEISNYIHYDYDICGTDTLSIGLSGVQDQKGDDSHCD